MEDYKGLMNVRVKSLLTLPLPLAIPMQRVNTNACSMVGMGCCTADYVTPMNLSNSDEPNTQLAACKTDS